MSTAAPKPRPDLIDVIVAASGSLAFLDKWRAVLQPYHLVIIQTGSSPVSVPAGFDAEVHTPADAKAKLGAKAWVVVSPEGQLSPAYGFLVSKKRYVYTIGRRDRPCHAAAVIALGGYLEVRGDAWGRGWLVARREACPGCA
eukprot:355355-Chlamydomonas_euryale.AAC.5